MGLKRKVRGNGTLATRHIRGKCNISEGYGIPRESGNVTCYESGKGPVDPASDEDHWKHIGDVSLHHVRQHAGICVSGTETKCAIADKMKRIYSWNNDWNLL